MRKLIAPLAFVSMLVSVLAVPVQGKAPLRGTMDLEFNVDWPGPQLEIPDWVGNITIDGTEYGMTFFWMATGKAFDVNRGVVSFFQEVWRIYDWITFDFETQVLDYGEVLLWGHDKGVLCYQNSVYAMNGNVEEAAGDFTVWQGHRVHMSGEIIWYDSGPYEGWPHYAPGTFRIN